MFTLLEVFVMATCVLSIIQILDYGGTTVIMKGRELVPCEVPFYHVEGRWVPPSMFEDVGAEDGGVIRM